MTLEQKFAPQWAGGWALSLRLFVLAQALELLRQARQVLDSFHHPTFNFGSGLLHFSNHALLSAPMAWGAWIAAVLGLCCAGWGGRLAKPGIFLWILAELLLFGGLGWEINAPERIMGWSALGLLLGPIGERDLTRKWRSPVGRWFFLIWMSGMYGMAGWMKLLEEPGWWDGSILAQGLADPIMGGTTVGIWLSHQGWALKFLDGFTLLFEISFGFLVFFAESNPFILGTGLLFHAGVSSLMSVGTLGLTVVSAYPVLLEPEMARRMWARAQGAWKTRRDSSAG